jgi:hypothetical protein
MIPIPTNITEQHVAEARGADVLIVEQYVVCDAYILEGTTVTGHVSPAEAEGLQPLRRPPRCAPLPTDEDSEDQALIEEALVENSPRLSLDEIREKYKLP